MTFNFREVLVSLASGLLLFSFLFSVNTLLTINAVDATFLNKGFVVALLEKHGFYDALYDNVLPGLLGAKNPEVAALVKQLLPPEAFKLVVNNIVSDLLHYLRDPSASIPVVVIPASGVLKETSISASEIFREKPLADAKSLVQLMLSLKTILAVVSLVLLAMIAVIPKTIPAKLKKIGYALFLAGFSGITFYLAFQYLVPAFPLPRFASPESQIQETVLNIFTDISSGIGNSILWQSVPLAVVGIVIALAGFWTEGRRKKKKKREGLGKQLP